MIRKERGEMEKIINVCNCKGDMEKNEMKFYYLAFVKGLTVLRFADFPMVLDEDGDGGADSGSDSDSLSAFLTGLRRAEEDEAALALVDGFLSIACSRKSSRGGDASGGTQAGITASCGSCIPEMAKSS